MIRWFDAKQANALECEVYSRIEDGFDLVWHIGYNRYQHSATGVLPQLTGHMVIERTWHMF